MLVIMDTSVKIKNQTTCIIEHMVCITVSNKSIIATIVVVPFQDPCQGCLGMVQRVVKACFKLLDNLIISRTIHINF